MITPDIKLFRSLYCRVVDAYGVMDECGTRTIRDLLTEDVLRLHFEGKKRIGAFFLDKEGMTDQLAIDIDKPELEQAVRVWQAFRDLGIYAYIESSKSKGFHVRTHWSPPLPSSELRNVGRYVTAMAGIPHAEVFPKQDFRGEGGLGNFMFLPFHGGSLQEGKTAFLDPENVFRPVADPWEALGTIRVNVPETLALAISIIESKPLRGVSRQPTQPMDDRISEGARNTALTSVAGRLRRIGKLETEIFDELQTVNSERCDPPLPEEEVRRIAKSISRYPPKARVPRATVVVIDAGNQDLPFISGEAWKAIAQENNPPRLFLYAGEPVRLERALHGKVTIQRLTPDRLRNELARAARWIKYKGINGSGEERAAYPPKDVVLDMLADSHIPLPQLSAIVKAPMYTSSGRLIFTPGYNEESGVYYAPGDDLLIPDISDCPSFDDLEFAQDVLLRELLVDFPFVGVAERAHAVSLLLLPFVRALVDGPTPLHLIEKPTPGTGASLLAGALLYPATGEWPAAMTEGGDENEWRKRITAALHEGRPVIFIDNLLRRLDSAAISAALTSMIWTDRRLGSSEIIRIPNRAVYVATGNNPSLSTELSRRTVRIRLDAKQDQPFLRRNFRHPDLKTWVERNRSNIVRAALILIQRWIAAGRPTPPSAPKLGMFERYSSVIGGILHVNHIPGFLSNLNSFFQESDDEGAAVRSFVAAWWEKYQGNIVGVAKLFDIASSEDSAIDLGNGQERSQKTRLGKLLRKLRDRRYQQSDGLSVRVVRVQAPVRAAQWQLQKDDG